MSVLQTIDLKKYYGEEPNITRALDGVNFSVDEGEFVAVVGTSGSGKSTLLHMMGGLDTPTSGSVFVRDKDLSKMSDEQLTIFRRRNIGFIFQNYNLVPILNVYENIVLPIELDGDTADQRFMDNVRVRRRYGRPAIYGQCCEYARTGRQAEKYAEPPFRRSTAACSDCPRLDYQTGDHSCR